MASAAPRAGSVRAKLFVNSILAVSFIAISAPQATRIPAHEWLSLAFIGVLALHLLFSWNWILNVTRRFFAALRGEVRFNYLWDSLLYLFMVVVMVSGIVISESALPALGIPRPRDRFWSVVHDFTSEALLVMVGVHLAMHWDWILTALKRLTSGTLAAPARANAGAWWVKPTAILSVVALLLSVGTLTMGSTSFAAGMRGVAQRERRALGGGAGEEEPNLEERRERRRRLRAEGGERGGAEQRGARAGGGGAEQRERRREGNPGLSARQRYVQPALKIGAFMGIPFLLTLGALTVVGRLGSGGAAPRPDPLDESGE